MIEIVEHLVAWAERNCPAYERDSALYAALAVAVWTPWFVQAALFGLAYFRREALFWLVGVWSTLGAVLGYALVAAVGYNDRPAGGCRGGGASFPSASAQYMGLVSGVGLGYWYGWSAAPTGSTALALFVGNAGFVMARMQLRYDSVGSLIAGYALGLAQAAFWMSLTRAHRRRVEWLRTSWLGRQLDLYDTLCVAHGERDASVDPSTYASPPAGSSEGPPARAARGGFSFAVS